MADASEPGEVAPAGAGEVGERSPIDRTPHRPASHGERDGGAVERSETAPDAARARRGARRDGQNRDGGDPRQEAGARSRTSVPENARSDAAPSRPRRAGTGAGGGRPSQ